MLHPFSRTELLLGEEALKRLSQSRVAVFGLGGVGGYAVEALARSGIGTLDLIDHDTISMTNINRQILATHDTVGQSKALVAAQRVKQINPNATVHAYTVFYTPETQDQFDFRNYDYIIDAIDTVTGKLALVINAQSANTPIISSMGTGNKLDPTAFEVADISKTSFCPLARIMRKELKRRGIEHLKVVYSKEEPLTPSQSLQEETPGRRQLPGSVAFVPSVAGLIIAGEVIKDLIK
ncbi:MAG: tRNA threonylcarbamoyladenosine dehydratase [Ruminococcaceae bacterium]|nr:tRNA threonylcarbamoyladenosine dehydratase [Oscillospiraceae bacterium]